ncbi:MAG: phenylalanine--tRNA ligase subunit alpha [Gammaproteobacteria bacterium]|nr:phenylalanine--tRNA ligase subunit alpha [Gammaproteobacteria bacterium]
MNKEELREKIKQELANSKLNLQTLSELRAQYLGKKGPIQELMLEMKNLPKEEKPAFGEQINALKVLANELFEAKKKEIEERMLQEKLKKEAVDISLPGKSINQGSYHIVEKVIEEIEDLFIGMGYEVKDGPEVENDEFNFRLLNVPKNHPARAMQDTFYISEDLLLRTQTSAAQAHTMLEYKGERDIRIICPGKAYRRDEDDATHSHQFTQIEGLVIGKHVTMAELKGTLEVMAKKLFGEDREIRLRPSYFPFTEPSIEVDVSCFKCRGKGCALCKDTGWIEILGAGMVHNNVLEMCGYNPNVYQGFAFGVGVERIAMLKYGIEDIRSLYSNDLRLLKQFKL